MRHNCLILTVFVLALLLQSGCQEQAKIVPATETQTKLMNAKPKPTADSQKSLTTESNTTRPEADEWSPKITFEKMVYNFGEISPMSKNLCEFKFTNTGNSTLKIKKVTKTCGCTPFTLEKKEYAPGESGTLKVNYYASSRAGRVSKSLFVYSNDKFRPKAGITIKAKIVPKVSCKPSNIELLPKQENAGCPEITLTSIDGRPFSIRQFQATAGCMTADYDPSKKATQFVLHPKVDVEKLQKGARGRINITLSHPGAPKATIPFSVLQDFKINPPSIFVSKAKPQKPIKKEVWILNNYEEDFEIESARPKGDIIKILSQEKIGKRYKFVLEITPPAVEDDKKFFSDTLYVKIKGGRKLRVNCNGFY